MGNFTAQNSSVFHSGTKNYIEHVVKPKLEAMLRKLAQDTVSYIDGAFSPIPPHAPGGNELFPVWEGQLRDATGCAVYLDGRVSSFIPTSKARYKQSDKASGIVDIVGSVFLKNAINLASSRFTKGLWIVIFSATPYAFRIDAGGSSAGRGKGYFETIKNVTVQRVIEGLKPIK